MSRGGKREGAGRPVGAENKVSAEQRAEIAASGLTPLAYMLAVMRDEAADEAKRLDAAKAAAPYVHPRLNATAFTATTGESFEDWVDSLK